MFKLKDHEYIHTAYAESAAGPGWGNSPIWVVIQNMNGGIRIECIQPGDQTQEMYILYGTSQASHLAMKNAVLKKLKQ